MREQDQKRMERRLVVERATYTLDQLEPDDLGPDKRLSEAGHLERWDDDSQTWVPTMRLNEMRLLAAVILKARRERGVI